MIRLGLPVAAIVYIYVRMGHPDAVGFFKYFGAHFFQWHQWLMVLACLVLVPVNWLLESLKWQRLVRDVEDLSLWKAFKATLSGVGVGLFTINRVGEFGGRVMFMKSENRVSGVMRTLMGSFSQLLVTLIFGSLSFAYLGAETLQLPVPVYQSLMICAVAGSALLLGIYFQYGFFIGLIDKTKLYQWMLGRGFKPMQLLKAELNRALMLSFFRYLVFNIQFVLLVLSFGCPVSWLEGLLATSCLFFIQTTVPTVSFMELGIRGAGAMLIFGWFGCEEVPVLTASFLIWFVNLILPALAGLFFFLKEIK